MPLANLRRQFPRLPDQIQILGQIAEPQFHRAALLLAEQFARPAQFQIRLRDFEAVIGLLQNFQPRLRFLVFILRIRNKGAKAFVRAVTDAPAQNPTVILPHNIYGSDATA